MVQCMAKQRKVSEFTPPPNFPGAGAIPCSAAVCPDSSGSLGRRFSHEKPQVPIALSTTADDLEFIDRISSSTLADVVRVRRKDTKETLAVKAFNHFSWRSEYLCHAELRIFQTIDSPWIVNFFGYIKDFREDFLLLEYLPHGNLLELVEKHTLTENQVKFYAAEMFLAVNSLHKHGIMHRNIQLSNFLLHSSGHIRITGFGMTYQFNVNPELTTDDPTTERERKKSIFRKKDKPTLARITNPVFSSPDKAIPSPAKREEDQSTKENKFVVECSTSYMAPEVLRLVMPKPYFQMLRQKLGYSHLCDYWSLGVAIYRMLYGQYPFTADSKGLILDKVLNHRKTLTFPFSHVTVAGTSLVKSLLKKESQRLGRICGFAEVLNNNFFEDLRWSSLGHGVVAVPVRNSDLARYSSRRSITPGHPFHLALRETLESCASASSEESVEAQAPMLAETMDKLDRDFQLPLCSDPSVAVTARNLEDQKRKLPGPSILTNRRVMFPSENRRDEEKTYLQKLMAWFSSNPFSTSRERAIPYAEEADHAD